MYLTHFITMTLALGAAAAPKAEAGTKDTNTNVARGGYGGCSSGGYYYEDRCYCHNRNYLYSDHGCSYHCHDDSYYDYDNECCSCYNSYDYSDSYGCSGGY